MIIISDIEITKKYIDLFWTRVNKNGRKIEYVDTNCWDWMGYVGKTYGKMNILGKTISVHRLSWVIHYGEIPIKMCVLHKCDNHYCVNPDHLFLGTNKDNSEDMMIKDRGPTGERHGSKTKPEKTLRGERCGSHKLTKDEVIEILNTYDGLNGITQKEIAAKYGVDRSAITLIINKKNWRWLNE